MQKQRATFVAVMFVSVAALLSVAHFAVAQEQRSTAPVPNTVWVGADGKFESEPDTALVQFDISAQEEKLPDASRKANEAAEQVRRLLRDDGIDPQQAQISRFATQPVYDYKNAKRKLVGYRVEANISVKVKDFAKIERIAEGLANMDVTNTSINYTLDNMQAAKIKAVEDAMRKARDEANAVAQSGGRTLGELSYASVDTYEPQPIRPMMARAMVAGAEAAPPPPPPPPAEFGVEKITVTAHVNALYNLKTATSN